MAPEDFRKNIGENGFLGVKKFQTENVVKKWDKLIQKLI